MSVLQQVWSVVQDGNVVPDVRARVISVQARIDLLTTSSASVCELVLSHGDNLSTALQSVQFL